MPKHPYSHAKREKELKRLRKREEKEQRRLDRAAAPPDDPGAVEPAASDPSAPE